MFALFYLYKKLNIIVNILWKKLFLNIFFYAIITAGCSKSDSGEPQKSNSEQKPDNQPQTKIEEKLPIVTMEVRTDESLENVLYPSFFIV